MSKHHPRIHPINYPVLVRYPADHPAVRALRAHAEARDICVGREIEWPKLGNVAIDQEWSSAIDQRIWKFSSFAYAFISFDFVADGWLDEQQSSLQPFEEDFLRELPRLRKLLAECESAANADGNDDVLPLISKAREFFDAFEESIVARIGPVDVESGSRRIDSLWSAGRRAL